MLPLGQLLQQAPQETQIFLDKESGRIEILLEPGVLSNAEWISGEAGDICLYRAMNDNRVVGAFFPLKYLSLQITQD